MKLKRCRGYAERVDDETVNEGMPIQGSRLTF